MKISEIENHLGKFRVGIAGAGGLGSNCAAALARSGIGTIVIADLDVVDESNLSRQFYFSDQTGMPKTDALRDNLIRIGKNTEIIAYQGRLDRNNIRQVFSGCDVIVEALDSSEMKEMFIEAVSDDLPDTPLIIGSGVAGWGGNDMIRSRKVDETLFVCGDETSEMTEELPVMAPKVGMIANMQANIVIELLMQKPDKRDPDEDNAE